MIEAYPQKIMAKIGFGAAVLLAFLILYQPWQYGKLELQQHEGFLVAQALEMNYKMPMSVVHGVGIKNGFFLYPLTLSAAIDAAGKYFHCDNVELIARVFNLVFIFLSGLLVFLSAGIGKNYKAGIVGFALMCTNSFVFEKSLQINTLSMTVPLIFGAQLIWFYFGFVKSKWNLSWILSMFLLVLAFLSGGFVVLVYFFLPLLFMHRPLKLAPKLKRPGFAVGLALFIGGLVIWVLPYLTMNESIPLNYIPFSFRSLPEYFLNLAVMPFDLMFRLGFWLLIIWIPFCVALRPLDDSPIYSHYLRVIFWTNAIFIWLNPFGNFADFLIVIPSLAVLCGMNYDIALRRYSIEVRKMANICGYFLLLSAVLMLLYLILPTESIAGILRLNAESLIVAKGNTAKSYLILLFVIIDGAAAFWMFYYCKKGQIWLVILVTSVMIGVFFWSVMFPVRQLDRSRSQLGLELKRALDNDKGSEKVLYKAEILDLYSECYYFGYPVKKIESLNELPEKSERIYLLGVDFPQFPGRSWNNLFSATYRGRKLYLWRGDLVRRKHFVNRRENGAENGKK